MSGIDITGRSEAIGVVVPLPSATPSPNGSPPAAAAPDEPVANDTLPATPPPDVLAEVAAAGATAAALQASGLNIHFEASGPGRVAVELQDAAGQRLRSLTPAQALELAGRPPVDGTPPSP